MRLLFIRHGDPDYEKDSLTEEGWKEAELLSNRICSLKVKEFYVSPLGRAKDTASLTLKKTSRKAEEKDWLREFFSPVKRPYEEEISSYCWDWIPREWADIPELYDRDKWLDVPCMKEAGIRKEYERVTESLDALLADHGYRRRGKLYEAVHPNHDTLVFFTHYGATVVFISHLLNVSPMPLWQGIMSAPTGVTEFATEERIRKEAVFRMLTYGDVSHLYGHCSPSFAGRFQECYDDHTEHK